MLGLSERGTGVEERRACPESNRRVAGRHWAALVPVHKYTLINSYVVLMRPVCHGVSQHEVTHHSFRLGRAGFSMMEPRSGTRRASLAPPGVSAGLKSADSFRRFWDRSSMAALTWQHRAGQFQGEIQKK